MEMHSIAARVLQIQQVFAAIMTGTYGGTIWDKGKYVIQTRGAVS
jgi:hypothetical protein